MFAVKQLLVGGCLGEQLASVSLLAVFTVVAISLVDKECFDGQNF